MTSPNGRRWACAASLLVLGGLGTAQTPRAVDTTAVDRFLPERILANDNRSAAGTQRHDTLTLRLVAREGRWFPESDSGLSIVVQAFAEEGHPLHIPGPLVRVRSGTVLRVSVRNTLGSTLVLFGMHRRPGPRGTTLRVPAGERREVTFRAGAPGSYFYWGSTTGNGMRERDNIDTQLYGAFIVDSANAVGPPRDRIFVIGVLHEGPVPPPDMMVINGKSWPYTERLDQQVGDTVHWRWLNPSAQPHPMHLHGFYFNVESRGGWAADTVYAPADRRAAVTETMYPGATMTMSWAASKPGNWLFHCHFGFHVSHSLSMKPVPPDKEPDSPNEVDHTVSGMAGLVLGIVAHEKPGSHVALAAVEKAARDIRLFMQASPPFSPPGTGLTLYNYAFVEEHGSKPPAPDSLPKLSSPLVLRRDEPVRITIESRLPHPGAVHWHGIEVQNSYVDGVPGWSGSASRLAPAVMPGGSFIAEFTPTRAGTFIYHSHSNEYFQIAAGLAAPLIVLEPGAVYDTTTDKTIFVNESLDGRGRINGVAQPDTLRLVVGTAYRFRLIDIAPDFRIFASLVDAVGPVRWRAMAKDGADLPPNQRTVQTARVPMGPGETADFSYTPTEPGSLILDVSTQVEGWTIRIPIQVRRRTP